MPRPSIVRKLTSHEGDVLQKLLDAVAEGSAFRSQIPELSVVGQCGCGCGTIDLAVSGHRAALASGSEVVVEATGTDPNGIEVVVMLLASAGYLSCLEVYSPAGVDGVALPTLESMVVS